MLGFREKRTQGRGKDGAWPEGQRAQLGGGGELEMGVCVSSSGQRYKLRQNLSGTKFTF